MPMTKDYQFTAAGIEALTAQGSMFNGRSYRIEAGNVVSYYGGNSDHVKMAAFASKVSAPVALATPAQIAYLSAMIADDYGLATTVGAKITPNLTKAAASRMIDLMKSEA